MSHPIRVGLIGAGLPAHRHAEGYIAAGGYQLAALAEPLPSRQSALAREFSIPKVVGDAQQIFDDPRIDVVSLCVPNHLHFSLAIAAMKKGKHVLCETPPAVSLSEAKKMATASQRSGKVLLYATQRRFGAAEQAARQAIEKQYIGNPRHVRASWMRTRGTPAGTGWYSDKSRAGGGALLDLGLPMLDLAWSMLGEPEPQSVFAITADYLGGEISENGVEPAGFALIRLAGGCSIELAASWAMNLPSKHQGTLCRVHGSEGAIDVYTPAGPMLSRKFDEKGQAREIPMKLPKVVQFPALMRHFKRCITGAEQPLCGPSHGVMLMRMIEAIYKSAQSGKSVQLAGSSDNSSEPTATESEP